MVRSRSPAATGSVRHALRRAGPSVRIRRSWGTPPSVPGQSQRRHRFGRVSRSKPGGSSPSPSRMREEEDRRQHRDETRYED